MASRSVVMINNTTDHVQILTQKTGKKYIPRHYRYFNIPVLTPDFEQIARNILVPL